MERVGDAYALMRGQYRGEIFPPHWSDLSDDDQKRFAAVAIIMVAPTQSLNVRYANALTSIANNTCCEKCNEAAQVAVRALAVGRPDGARLHLRGNLHE